MILIISDYHHRENKVLDLIEKYHPDRIFCLGDSESEMWFLDQNNILAVKGNCDYIDLPINRIIEVDGKRFLLTHGHQYGVRFSLDRLYYLALENKADYVLYGHTHYQKLEIIDGITFLNPGALLNDKYALYEDGKITLY